MTKLVLTDEQQMLQETTRRFVTERAPVSLHRRLRDEENTAGFDRGVWRGLVELGLPGIAIPEAYGGLGFGYVGAGIVALEMGRTLCAAPFVSSAVMAATVLLRAHNAAQKNALLPGIASGEILAALAVDESGRHEPDRAACEAQPAGDGYTLHGVKRAVIDGAVAQWLVVSARVPADKGYSVFLVNADAPGVSIAPEAFVDHRNCARIEFDGVEVTGEALLGTRGLGADTLDAALDAGRVCLAAEMLGGAEHVFAMTIDYLKSREQFGVPIGSFQALQHRAAMMYGELELCYSVVLKALQALDAGGTDVAPLASLAKARANATLTHISAEAIQMHGGIGVTDELDVGFYYKRAAVAGQLLGDADFHADRYARLRKY